MQIVEEILQKIDQNDSEAVFSESQIAFAVKALNESNKMLRDKLIQLIIELIERGALIKKDQLPGVLDVLLVRYQ